MKKSRKRNSLFEELKGTTEEIISQVRKLIKKGNVRRLIIQNKKGKILFQTQLTAGMAGTLLIVCLSPIIAAIGFFGVILSDIKVIVEKYPDSELDNDENEVKAEVIEIKEQDESDAEDEQVDINVGKNQ